MGSTERRSEHLFVVRVTRERGAFRPPPWRGSIEHVGSGTRRYFSRLADILEFVAELAPVRDDEAVALTISNQLEEDFHDRIP